MLTHRPSERKLEVSLEVCNVSCIQQACNWVANSNIVEVIQMFLQWHKGDDYIGYFAETQLTNYWV